MFKRTAFHVCTLVVLLFPTAANAAQRTFVSAGSGSDSNSCTRALPCRNFAAAVSQTDAGGEVVVLDSGGYGVVAITQSVALIAPPGVHAAITAFSGDAVDVLAGATDVVILRGLYLSGLGGTFGIELTSGKTLHVENCVISGFSNIGVLGRAGDIYVLDTVSRQNGYGFYFSAPTAVRASLDSVRAEENAFSGVVAEVNSLVTVTRSVAAGHEAVGFFSAASSGEITLESCTTMMNSFGVRSFGTARVRNSMITANTIGVAHAAGASTISFGNNALHGNGTDGSFTTTVPQQ